MPAAVQKITLSSSRDIPFNKLVLSQSNVRRVKAGVSIEELAASIARRGLLQSLNVRPVRDAGGRETGMFEVPAGGRRFRALELSVKQKRLAKTAPVPCVLRDPSSATMAEEDSLAENIERAPLHPLDQFRAFQDLRLKGQSEQEIAAAFFIPGNVVIRHVQLKSSHGKAKTQHVGINTVLAGKPSGCVVWMHFDPQTMALGPFLWFGAEPGAPLPPLGDKVAKHSKGNAQGVKTERPNIRLLKRNVFEVLPTIGAVGERLFGV